MTHEFWEEWSGHFPVSATYNDGEDTALPEGVTFERAGQSVFLSLDELNGLVWGLKMFYSPHEEGRAGRWEEV